MYINLQKRLSKATPKEVYDAELAKVLEVYGEDLDAYQLEGQLLHLPQVVASMGFDTSRFNSDDLI